MRRYDNEVQVRSAPGEPLAEPAPDAFVWRGRLYVVRAVLARWHERRAWWRDSAAAALLGLQADPVPAAAPGASSTGTGSGTRSSTGRSNPPAAALAGECHVWRVEAAAGRSGPLGVYDLVNNPGVPSTWHLARVAD